MSKYISEDLIFKVLTLVKWLRTASKLFALVLAVPNFMILLPGTQLTSKFMSSPTSKKRSVENGQTGVNLGYHTAVRGGTR